MRKNSWLVVTALCLAAGAAAQNPPAAAGQLPSVPEVFQSKGIHYFVGRVRCPLAGVGARGAYASNRLVLEDEHSRAVVDRSAHRILFTNTHAYKRKALVGELLFLGVGVTEAGERVPVGIHLHLEKRGTKFDARTHIHPTVREKVVSAEFEPFQVVVNNGQAEEVVLTRESALEAVRELRPGLGIDQPRRPLAPENLHELRRVPVGHGMTGVHRDPGGVIGGDDIVEGQQSVVQGWRLHGPDIDPRTAELAGCQGVRQRLLIDDAAARRVDEEGARPHQGQLPPADQSPGLCRQRAVDGDVIGLRQ